MESNTTSGQTSSGGANEGEDGKDTVAYETHKKLLGEKKKRDQEVNELRSELEALKSKDMEAKGEQTKLIEALRKENTELKTSREKAKNQYGWNVVSSNIKAVAAQMGCQDGDALIKLGDWESIEVDKDNFTVQDADVKRAVSEAQKKYPYLFKKTVPGTKDLPPGNREPNSGERKSLDKMTVGEMKSLYTKMRTKEGYRNG